MSSANMFTENLHISIIFRTFAPNIYRNQTNETESRDYRIEPIMWFSASKELSNQYAIWEK